MTLQDVTSKVEALATILLGNQAPVLEIGATVRLADGRVGKVQNIAISPYYDEERYGVWRVYIYSASWFDEVNPERWTEWALIDDCEVIQ